MAVNLNSILAPHGINCLTLAKLLKCNKIHASLLLSGVRMLSPADIRLVKGVCNISLHALVSQQNEWLLHETLKLPERGRVTLIDSILKEDN